MCCINRPLDKNRIQEANKMLLTPWLISDFWIPMNLLVNAAYFHHVHPMFPQYKICFPQLSHVLGSWNPSISIQVHPQQSYPWVDFYINVEKAPCLIGHTSTFMLHVHLHVPHLWFTSNYPRAHRGLRCTTIQSPWFSQATRCCRHQAGQSPPAARRHLRWHRCHMPGGQWKIHQLWMGWVHQLLSLMGFLAGFQPPYFSDWDFPAEKTPCWMTPEAISEDQVKECQTWHHKGNGEVWNTFVKMVKIWGPGVFIDFHSIARFMGVVSSLFYHPNWSGHWRVLSLISSHWRSLLFGLYGSRWLNIF